MVNYSCFYIVGDYLCVPSSHKAYAVSLTSSAPPSPLTLPTHCDDQFYSSPILPPSLPHAFLQSSVNLLPRHVLSNPFHQIPVGNRRLESCPPLDCLVHNRSNHRCSATSVNFHLLLRFLGFELSFSPLLFIFHPESLFCLI